MIFLFCAVRVLTFAVAAGFGMCNMIIFVV